MHGYWLRAVESDLRPLNIGLSLAWSKATNQDAWRSVVDTATLKTSLPRTKEKKMVGRLFIGQSVCGLLHAALKPK